MGLSSSSLPRSSGVPRSRNQDWLRTAAGTSSLLNDSLCDVTRRPSPNRSIGVTTDGGESYEAAFGELVLPAFRVALRILGNHHDAEEVAAEAMARALRSWDRVRDLPHRQAWVLRVASNVAVDRTRRHPPGLDATDHVPDLAEAVSLRLALGAALQKLPRRQREVVSLRYLADISEAEVARSLGISLNSVKKHTARGMTALRSRLGVEWQEEHLALE